MSRVLVSSILLASASLLTACGGNEGYADLDSFMKAADEKPAGRIDPLPEMIVYESFKYSEAGSRSPFTAPVEEVDVGVEIAEDQSNIKPNFDRPKELLESFQLTQLRMVGTLQKQDSATLWALISDNSGGVHRVQEGQYMGKNHGRVVAIQEAGISLIEIVPNGNGGWIERPRSVTLEDI
ncbi:MAG: pilus assembly protein PilP [Oleiphilaceae bacterium]|nr:pilus assembly protein PilP [Oleiphilaceae bacterium]